MDEIDDGVEQLRVLDLIAIQPVYQLLTGMLDDFIREWDMPQCIECSWVELEGALVFQLIDDVLLDDVDRRLRIDEVLVENLFE